jgi:hypothetical protein
MFKTPIIYGSQFSRAKSRSFCLGSLPLMVVSPLIFNDVINVALIGCTTLLAVSGILRTQADGSPLALCAGLRRRVCGTGPLVIGVSWAARDCNGSPARSLPPALQGEAAVGGARAGAATDGSPLALCAGLRVCGTGPVTGVSAGRERCIS